MAVYVDALRWRGMTICGRDVKSCHLTADSLEELKAFAEKIGITSDWIHHGTRSHFDLVRRFRGTAIANGAIVGDDLQELDKEYARRGIGGCARKKYLQQIQAFIRWFNRYYLPHPQRIEVPPLPMIGIVRKEIGWIDTPEQETVLAAIRFENLHLAYRVLFATGMRIGEVCGLKKRDLVRNDDGTFLYVQRAISQWKKEKPTKTGSWMMKPIPGELFLALSESCRDKFPESFLWTTRYGNPYSPGRLSTVWHRASMAVGLNISLYAACRHSKATREMIELQKEIWRKVGKVLGDTVKITKGYVRSITEKRKVGG